MGEGRRERGGGRGGLESGGLERGGGSILYGYSWNFNFRILSHNSKLLYSKVLKTISDLQKVMT
jgi:hypothetical protein